MTCTCDGICCCAPHEEPVRCSWCEKPAVDGELCGGCRAEAEEEAVAVATEREGAR